MIGFVFALIGGALSVSWAPGETGSDEEQLDEQDPRRASSEKDLPYEDVLHAAAVPQQQAAGPDLAADADAGRHRAG